MGNLRKMTNPLDSRRVLQSCHRNLPRRLSSVRTSSGTVGGRPRAQTNVPRLRFNGSSSRSKSSIPSSAPTVLVSRTESYGVCLHFGGLRLAPDRSSVRSAGPTVLQETCSQKTTSIPDICERATTSSSFCSFAGGFRRYWPSSLCGANAGNEAAACRGGASRDEPDRRRPGRRRLRPQRFV